MSDFWKVLPSVFGYIAVALGIVLIIVLAFTQLPAEVHLWLAKNQIELTARTGWLEIFGWCIALILAITGLILAWQRTDALKASVIETRKSHSLTLKSIEATQKQIEIAAQNAEHDTETEMRKQFREACGNLESKSVALSYFGMSEMLRISHMRPKWFAKHTIEVLQFFLQTDKASPQVIDYALTCCSQIMTDTKIAAAVKDIPYRIFVEELHIPKLLNGMNISNITFVKCTFLEGFFESRIFNCRFIDCEFYSPANIHFHQTMISACRFHWKRDAHNQREILFSDCDLNGTTIYSSTPSTTINLNTCGVDAANFTGQVIVNADSDIWHFGNPPRFRTKSPPNIAELFKASEEDPVEILKFIKIYERSAD